MTNDSALHLIDQFTLLQGEVGSIINFEATEQSKGGLKDINFVSMFNM
jgi:hypothetical protein